LPDVNNFKDFEVNRGKQYVASNYEVYLIGDAILYCLDENRFDLVGHAMVPNWVQYHAETGGYDARVERDEDFASTAKRRIDT
jgi:vanillate/3-O-methylgallate O-demethylase